MIQFFLNDVQVYPVDNQVITFKDYNTLCEASDGKGAYTYDIDFDLNVNANAEAFNWTEKINTANIPTGRNAKMIVDGTTIFEGTECLLNVTGMTAKIQVLCGNSEVNFRGNDTRIKNLPLPTIKKYSHTEAKDTLKKNLISGNDHVVFVPVMIEYDKWPYNEDSGKFANFIDKDTVWDQNGPSFVKDTMLIPQPSLVWVIEEVIKAVGFELQGNDLETLEFAKDMVIIHGYESLKLCEILPNWTVNEFLSEVQKMFNVTILFKDNGIAKIVKVGEFYKHVAQTSVINYYDFVDIKSTFERAFDRKEEYIFNYDRMKYDFPDSYYYRRADFNDTIQSLCQYVLAFGFSKMENTDILNENNYNKPEIYSENETGTTWIISKDGPTAKTVLHWERVNHFKNYISPTAEENATENVLKIVPAEVFCLDIHPKDSSDHYFLMGAGVAYARNKTSKKDEVDENKGLNDWIDGTPPEEEDTRNNKLFVAQVEPNAHVLWKRGGSSSLDKYEGARHPNTFVTRYMNGLLHAAGTTRYAQILDNGAYEPDKVDAKDFNLTERHRDVYAKGAVVKENEVYTVKYKSKVRRNVQDIYIMNGKKFICVSNEYTIEKGHVSPFVIGTFLPLIE